MGTEVQLKAFHADPERVARAFEMAEQRVRELELILTDYNPQSETRQLSDRAARVPTVVSDPLWEMLVACDRWHRLSQGAFDGSLGQLTHLWRKYRRSERHPTAEQIDSARAMSGWQHVRLNDEDHSVHFDSAALMLDFGAIGKGYIVDQAYELLLANEVPCAMVNVSGNMRAGIAPPERIGWRIEIAPLEPGGKSLRQVHIASQAIATSGDLWQFVVIDGVRRSHILDPKNGLGVEGPRCATVISPTAVDADALATTACIVGFDAAVDIARKLAKTELLWADRINEVGNCHTEVVRQQATPNFPADISVDTKTKDEGIR